MEMKTGWYAYTIADLSPNLSPARREALNFPLPWEGIDLTPTPLLQGEGLNPANFVILLPNQPS